MEICQFTRIAMASLLITSPKLFWLKKYCPIRTQVGKLVLYILVNRMTFRVILTRIVCNVILFEYLRKSVNWLGLQWLVFTSTKSFRASVNRWKNFIQKTPDWKSFHRLSERLASLGIMAAQLRIPLKPYNTIVLWCTGGWQPNKGP